MKARRHVVERLRRRVLRRRAPRPSADSIDPGTKADAQRHRSFDSMSGILAWQLQLAESAVGSLVLEGSRALEIGSGKFLAQALALYACGCREVVSVDRHRLVHRDAVAESLARPVLARRFLSAFASHDDFTERMKAIRETDYDLERLRALGVDYQAPVHWESEGDLRDRFDLAISYTVLEHVASNQVSEVLRAAWRTLTPGGVCVHFVDLEDHANPTESPFGFLAADSDWEPTSCLRRGNRMRFSRWRRIVERESDVEWSYPYVAVRHDVPLPDRIDPDIGHDGEEDLRTSGFVLVGRRLR
jgi:SAM-dependent methyltransferase